MFALLLLGAATGADDASAQPYRAREGVQNGQVRSLDQIVSGVRRQRPGNLADVEGPNFGPQGDAHYRLKWVSPDGRVQWLDTDARTGRILGVQGDERGGPPGYGPGAGYPPNPRGNFDPRGAYGPRGNIAPRNQGFEGPPDAPFDNGPPPNYGRGFRRGPDNFGDRPNGPEIGRAHV
mgnify:CR=1 FL=1